jgi:Animal haem peroxidase
MSSLGRRMLIKLSEAADRKWRWDRMPVPLGLLTLIGVRDALREKNLYDTYDGELPPAPPHDPAEYLTVRTIDGSHNDLSSPSMGMAGTRFGRNVPPGRGRAEEPPRLFDPNPRTVSNELLLRTDFKPAKTLNILAAAWLQFQTRDWFHHDTNTDRMIKVPRPPGDDWPDDPILMPSTPADETASPNQSTTTFINKETHWWDASQIYGSTPEFQKAVRTNEDGKVKIGADGLISIDPNLLGVSGGADGWWLGLELMSTVFMREHNAICDRLKSAYPEWKDDLLFDKARLINAALIAKIHTVEWTPAILGHPALQIGMRANWFGIAGERINKLFGRLSPSEVVSGIPGSPTEHHAAPYAITEDFVTVYRMHPLVPDDYMLISLAGDKQQHRQFKELHGGVHSREALESVGAPDALYSLGVAHPGAVTLHNNPRFMHSFERTDGRTIDLIAIDLLRSRERGVPRYNDFRRQLRLRPAATFDQISGGDQATANQLAEIYGNDIEKVDTTVGMFGEPLPKGFGFSDTAFRIFVLMASRRLKSDRFYTVDFTPRVYTPEGMAWIDDNDMVSVLIRHYPELGPVLRNQRNAFAPWPRVG